MKLVFDLHQNEALSPFFSKIVKDFWQFDNSYTYIII